MHERIRSRGGLTVAAAILAVCPCLASPQAEQHETDVRVSRAVTCLEIQNREPVNIDSVFSNQVGQIFCYTHIEGVQEESEIEHVWLHEGQERARVTLPVRSPDWRTWSSKRMLPSWTGEWKVEVRAADGSLLKTLEFTLSEGEAGGSPAESER